jgi:signal transduction histidine kinase
MVFFEVFAHVEAIPAEPRTTGLYVTVDAPGTVRLARQLLPATRSVAVVAGTPPRERAACASVSGQVRQEGLEVLDLCGLPMADVLQRVSSLPEATVVLYLSVSVDGAGVTFVPAEVATRVARDANRPVFSPHGTHLGRGVVGGVIIDYRMAGREIGEVARRVLAGEDPDRIPTRIAEVNRVALDARALRRWGIPRGRVPAGAEVVFDEPSLWQRYGQWILLGVLALVAQTFVIGALLVERRRRREAQRGAARAKELQDQIAHMNRVSSLGELSGAIAHELGQPLTAITSNAHATLSVLDRGEASIDDVRESVSDIALDARRASDVLGRMRAYLRREATAPRPVSLAAVADETARLVHATARRREVTVRVENAPDLPPVLGDEVQLLQVSLNLVTNAIEAAATGPGARQVTIRTQRAGASVELGVENSGSGIPPSVAERMFEPFFTTRADGLGMGLPICRTIVEAHGGRIWIRGDEPGRTELRFSLPQADVESLEVAAP